MKKIKKFKATHQNPNPDSIFNQKSRASYRGKVKPERLKLKNKKSFYLQAWEEEE